MGKKGIALFVPEKQAYKPLFFKMNSAVVISDSGKRSRKTEGQIHKEAMYLQIVLINRNGQMAGNSGIAIETVLKIH